MLATAAAAVLLVPKVPLEESLMALFCKFAVPTPDFWNLQVVLRACRKASMKRDQA